MRMKESLKALALHGAYRTGVFELGRGARKQKIPILCYHRFCSADTGDGSMPARLFEKHLRYLRKRFTPITFKQLDDFRKNPATIAHPLLLTVDDGYSDFAEIALPLLKLYEFPATLFPVSRFLDGEIWLWLDIVNYLVMRTTRKVIELPLHRISLSSVSTEEKRKACSRLRALYKKISEEEQSRLLLELPAILKVELPPSPTPEYRPVGWSLLKEESTFVEVGAHTLNHRILSHISPGEAEAEISGSKKRIEEVLGRPVIAFSYPNGLQGDYRECDKQSVRRSGLLFAVTCTFGFNTLESDPLELHRIVAQPAPAAFAKEISGFELLLHRPLRNGQLVNQTTKKSSGIVVSECGDDDRQKWDSFVREEMGGSVFHLYDWKNVFRDAYGNTCIFLRAEEKQETVGTLPLVFKKSRIFGRFLVSLPYFDCAGFCADRDDVREALLQHAAQYARRLGARYIEFRHDSERVPELPSRQSKVVMVLGLPPDPEELWASLKAKVRNQIRKATKEGLSVVSGREELLDDFFDVYARNMRDLGSPSHRESFFRYICAYFPNDVRIFCVGFGEKTLAAGFTIASEGMLHIPWASALREHNQKCPNMLLYWSILKHACESGFARFNFGRSTPEEGTFNFKKQWGATPVQLYWQYWLADGKSQPNLSMNNSKYSLPVRVWKNLPLSLTKKLGPRVIQNLA